MSWCKISSLTSAVVNSLRSFRFPATREIIINEVKDKPVGGWDLHFFLSLSLKRKKYKDIRQVMSDIEEWTYQQG